MEQYYKTALGNTTSLTPAQLNRIKRNSYSRSSISLSLSPAGDLGGQMGLFMGASFITIVELFFTACYVVRVVVCRAARVIHAKLSSSKNSTG
ncbi:Acid-sensing ion channel 1 [Portunus trituberculatus]|uniref:Acid-sensing ion channel 1 n=1 Tax=Portunus trituberculatus TaxID=210409 RepID=A0A5B7I1M3_PORTR|nr:Acid-sensing ion channel 1 [Portunus trituberculatus]